MDEFSLKIEFDTEENITKTEYDWHTVIAMNSLSDWERGVSCEVLMMIAEGRTFEKHEQIFDTDLSFELVDKWNVRCLMISTLECYNTQGSVTSNGKLRTSKKKWFAKKDYESAMKAFCVKHQISYSDLQLLDQNLRMKQARGYKWTLVRRENYSEYPNQCMIFLLDTKHYDNHKLGNECHHAPFIVNII